jgi:hypothetical protein
MPRPKRRGAVPVRPAASTRHRRSNAARPGSRGEQREHRAAPAADRDAGDLHVENRSCTGSSQPPHRSSSARARLRSSPAARPLLDRATSQTGSRAACRSPAVPSGARTPRPGRPPRGSIRRAVRTTCSVTWRLQPPAIPPQPRRPSRPGREVRRCLRRVLVDQRLAPFRSGRPLRARMVGNPGRRHEPACGPGIAEVNRVGSIKHRRHVVIPAVHNPRRRNYGRVEVGLLRAHNRRIERVRVVDGCQRRSGPNVKSAATQNPSCAGRRAPPQRPDGWCLTWSSLTPGHFCASGGCRLLLFPRLGTAFLPSTG